MKLKVWQVPECTDVFPISFWWSPQAQIYRWLGKAFELYAFFLLKPCFWYTFNHEHTQMYFWVYLQVVFLFWVSSAFRLCSEPYFLMTSEQRAWKNISLLSIEEGIVHFQAWHPSCFHSLQKGKGMGYWNQGIWDPYEKFAMRHHSDLLLCTALTYITFSNQAIFSRDILGRNLEK